MKKPEVNIVQSNSDNIFPTATGTTPITITSSKCPYDLISLQHKTPYPQDKKVQKII